VAVYPNLWMTSDLGMSETLTPLLVGWILWMAYRFWKRPTTATAVWMGVSLGVSMMGRDELSLLSVLIFVPLALLATALSWRRRLTLLGIGLRHGLLARQRRLLFYHDLFAHVRPRSRNF